MSALCASGKVRNERERQVDLPGDIIARAFWRRAMARLSQPQVVEDGLLVHKPNIAAGDGSVEHHNDAFAGQYTEIVVPCTEEPSSNPNTGYYISGVENGHQVTYYRTWYVGGGRYAARFRRPRPF